MNLRERSDAELVADVTNLVGCHREITAKLVQYFAEIEERRLHLKSGFPSMFAYCVKQLGLGETEAFRRIVAARLGRRFPMVFSLLASGRVHLTTLELLRERLTEENHRELLEAVAGKSKREVEATLATLFPRPDVLSSIRRLPEMESASSARPLPAASFDLEPSGQHHRQATLHARVEPLSPERYRIEFTARARALSGPHEPCEPGSRNRRRHRASRRIVARRSRAKAAGASKTSGSPATVRRPED